jgi:prepilin-type N-terminal cleavage/methylation domain-containing protein
MDRKGILEKLKKDENGVTLVELLAGIAILSIVVTAFLAFFIQAANTNKQTNEMNEATFLAQEVMEEITYYSNQNTYADIVEQSMLTSIEQLESDSGYSMDFEFIETENSLYKVIVTVKGGKDRAKMETRLPFENADE